MEENRHLLGELERCLGERRRLELLEECALLARCRALGYRISPPARARGVSAAARYPISARGSERLVALTRTLE